MRRAVIGMLLVLLLMLGLTACGNSQAETPAEPVAEAPSATAVPPTATPKPPTATPEPTSTPVPTAVPDENVFLNALTQSEQATSYRMEFDIAITGAPPELAGMLDTSGDQPVSVLALRGDVNGDDARMTMSGFLASFMGADPNQGLEIITVGEQSYLRGPIPLMGATEDRWYSIDQSDGAVTDFSSDPDEVFDTFREQDLESLNFAQSGTEALDGQQCTVYTLDEEGLMQLVQELDTDMAPEDLNTDDIESAEVKIWICDDGYFHKLEFSVEATPEETPEQTIAFNIMMHLYDFDSDITITAPEDAIPLETAFEDSPFGFGDTPDGMPFDFGDTPEDFPFDVDDSAFDPSTGTGTATVANGGNIRQAPSLQGQVLGQMNAGEEVILYEKTSDSRWYRVEAPAASGWVSVTLLNITTDAAQVPVQGQEPAAPIDPANLTATVANGGNVRAVPNLQGLVKDQINAFEEVQLLAKSSNGAWYKINNPRGVTGWVSQTLLTVDPAVASSVPVE